MNPVSDNRKEARRVTPTHRSGSRRRPRPARRDRTNSAPGRLSCGRNRRRAASGGVGVRTPHRCGAGGSAHARSERVPGGNGPEDPTRGGGAGGYDVGERVAGARRTTRSRPAPNCSSPNRSRRHNSSMRSRSSAHRRPNRSPNRAGWPASDRSLFVGQAAGLSQPPRAAEIANAREARHAGSNRQASGLSYNKHHALSPHHHVRVLPLRRDRRGRR